MATTDHSCPGEVIAPDVPMTPAAPSDQGGKFQILLNGGTQSLEVTSRSSSTSAQLESFNRPETGETIVVARGGCDRAGRDVQAVMPGGERLDLGTISLSADKIVGWFPLATGCSAAIARWINPTVRSTSKANCLSPRPTCRLCRLDVLQRASTIRHDPECRGDHTDP